MSRRTVLNFAAMFISDIRILIRFVNCYLNVCMSQGNSRMCHNDL